MAASTCCLTSQPCGSSLLSDMMARYSPRSEEERRMREEGEREGLPGGGAEERVR